MLEIQKQYNVSQWKDVPADKNYNIPPPHWHWYQDEYFEIKKGYDCIKSLIVWRWYGELNLVTDGYKAVYFHV